MTDRKTDSKQQAGKSRAAEFTAPFEHVFLAGLGALSNARKFGAQTFETLVHEGEVFRKDASAKTEDLIEDIQTSIRSMAGDAQSKATGLIDQMRDRSQLEKLQGVFDARVADAMDRMGVPSKNDIDLLNKKLDKILLAVTKKPARKASAAKKAPARKKAVKKTAEKVAETSAREAA